jgi:hypothetical protein
MYKVEVIVRVVNRDGDVVDHRGNPAFTYGGTGLSASRLLTQTHDSAAEASNALNLVWGFLNPIDNQAARQQ